MSFKMYAIALWAIKLTDNQKILIDDETHFIMQNAQSSVFTTSCLQVSYFTANSESEKQWQIDSLLNEAFPLHEGWEGREYEVREIEHQFILEAAHCMQKDIKQDVVQDDDILDSDTIG